MDNPQVTENDNTLNYLGGVFDSVGSCSISHDIPEISIINANPIISFNFMSLCNKHNVVAKMSERSKPSKSSKRKRWDIFITDPSSIVKMATILEPFVWGKKQQLQFFSRKKSDNNLLKYLNQTSNILIDDDITLSKRLNCSFEKNHLNINETTTFIPKENFCDPFYFSGILDCEGEIEINQMECKGENVDHFTPVICVFNTNKEVITKCLNTVKNLNIGCYVKYLGVNNNRAKWIINVSGVKRVQNFSNSFKNKVCVKNKQLELLYVYCSERLNCIDANKNVNTTGYNCKNAIEALNKEV